MRKSHLTLGAAALAMLAAACGGSAKPSATTSESPPAAGAPVTLQGTVNDKGVATLGAEGKLSIETDDFYFKPTFVKASPGQTASLEIKNEGGVQHTFTIDSLHVDQVLPPGSKRDVSFTLPASGIVNFYCRFHVGGGMQGALYFSPGGSASGGGSSSGGYGYSP